MSIRLVCDWFRNERTGQREYLINRAYDEDTFEAVCLEPVHPKSIGASDMGDGTWRLEDADNTGAGIG